MCLFYSALCLIIIKLLHWFCSWCVTFLLLLDALENNSSPIFDELKKIRYSWNITLEIYNPDKEYRKIGIDSARKPI